jgi:hypothetical protein
MARRWKLKTIKINEIEWHDAIINEIKIESQNDAYDSIKLFISSKAFLKEYNKESISIILEEVFKAKLEFNMWMSGKDVINMVSITEESEWISQVKEKLNNNFGPVNMKHFTINTNTNSRLEFLITKDLILD